MSRRTERVGELVRAEIARALSRDAADPRLRGVTITRVDVSPDMAQALVFWSTLEVVGAAPLDDVERGLESAAAFLRGVLARELSLKRVPRLRFRHDPSVEKGSRTLALLQEIADAEKG